LHGLRLGPFTTLASFRGPRLTGTAKMPCTLDEVHSSMCSYGFHIIYTTNRCAQLGGLSFLHFVLKVFVILCREILNYQRVLQAVPAQFFFMSALWPNPSFSHQTKKKRMLPRHNLGLCYACFYTIFLAPRCVWASPDTYYWLGSWADREKKKK
jgi:hypothetical protein